MLEHRFPSRLVMKLNWFLWPDPSNNCILVKPSKLPVGIIDVLVSWCVLPLSYAWSYEISYLSSTYAITRCIAQSEKVEGVLQYVRENRMSNIFTAIVIFRTRHKVHFLSNGCFEEKLNLDPQIVSLGEQCFELDYAAKYRNLLICAFKIDVILLLIYYV